MSADAAESGIDGALDADSVADSQKRAEWKAKAANALWIAAQYAALPIGIILLWQALNAAGLVQPLLLPPPTQVAEATWSMLKDGSLLKHLLASMARVLEGFGVAALIAIPLGVSIGLSKTAGRITDITLQVVKPIPPIAWIPLAILWFGIGEASKVYIIVLGALFPILVNTVDGIRQTEGRFVELAQVLEVSRIRFITKVVIPGALPSIMTGLRLGLGLAWVCVVAAELIAAEKGVGYLIMDARQLSEPDVVIMGMLVIGVVGKLMDSALRWIEGLFVRWKSDFRGE